MALEVVKLKPRFEDEYEREMVETLKAWLRRAEEGRFQALGLVAVCKDGSIDHEVPSHVAHPVLVGAMAMLQHDILVSATVDEVDDK